LLTAREVEIVNLLAKGLSGARVAAHLAIAESTVQAHVRNAMKKTGAANRTALVAYAMAEGLVRA
jgi:DNA-binding NarL/FixJ family response regulator